MKKIILAVILSALITSCGSSNGNFKSKNANDIKLDLLGHKLSGAAWNFDSLDEFNCLKIHKEEVKGEGAIVEYYIRTSLQGSRGSAVLTDMSVIYKISWKKLEYVSNRLDSTNVWGPVDCDGRDMGN